MKELAKIYEKDKINKAIMSCDFNSFFAKNKLIYPWLKKDTLRWHIHAMNKKEIKVKLQQLVQLQMYKAQIS